MEPLCLIPAYSEAFTPVYHAFPSPTVMARSSLMLHSIWRAFRSTLRVNGGKGLEREMHLAPPTFRSLPSPSPETDLQHGPLCFSLLLRAPWAPHSWVFRKSPTHFITCSSYLIQHPGYSPTVATSTSTGGKGGGLGHPRTSHINHRWRLIAGRLELASQLSSAFSPST